MPKLIIKEKQFENIEHFFDFAELIMMKTALCVLKKSMHQSTHDKLNKLWNEPLLKNSPALKFMKPLSMNNKSYDIQLRQALNLSITYKKATVEELANSFFTKKGKNREPIFKNKKQLLSSSFKSYWVPRSYYEKLTRKMIRKWLRVVNEMKILEYLDITSINCKGKLND